MLYNTVLLEISIQHALTYCMNVVQMSRIRQLHPRRNCLIEKFDFYIIFVIRNTNSMSFVFAINGANTLILMEYCIISVLRVIVLF